MPAGTPDQTTPAAGAPPATSASGPAPTRPAHGHVTSGKHSGTAPKVSKPIDPAGWQDKPCDLLTDKDLQAIGITSAETGPFNSGGPGCEYTQKGTTLRTTFTTELGGLSGLFAISAGFELWRELDPIKGHPAVIADTRDEQKEGRCTLIAGLNDAVAFRAIVQADPRQPAGQNPCALATDTTVTALHNLQAGQP